MSTAPFDRDRFHNFAPEPERPGGVLRWLLTRRRARWPAHVPNTAFPPPPRAQRGQIGLTFIGHSTFLLQLGELAILTDPIWSARASPLSFAGPRRARDPGQTLDAMPRVDVLLVSHCHYDHLDLPSLRAVRQRWAPPTVSGLGNARHLAKAGIADAQELDWWQAVTVAGARITHVPAQHFSARTPFDRNRALWGGFVVEADGHVVYFAGDTGYFPQLRELRDRVPRLDLALLPIGAYEPRWFMAYHHMNPADAVRAHLELDPKLSIGMHFGTFQLTDEAIDAPVRALAAACAEASVPADRFRILQFGETMFALAE